MASLRHVQTTAVCYERCKSQHFQCLMKHDFITGFGEPLDAHDSSQATLVKYFDRVNMAFDGWPCFTSVEQ